MQLIDHLPETRKTLRMRLPLTAADLPAIVNQNGSEAQILLADNLGGAQHEGFVEQVDGRFVTGRRRADAGFGGEDLIDPGASTEALSTTRLRCARRRKEPRRTA